MPAYLNSTEATILLTDSVNRAFANALKTLLESRHLYQSVAIDFPGICGPIAKQILLDDDSSRFRSYAEALPYADFAPSEQPLFKTVRPGTTISLPTLLLQNMKLFCSSCGHRETFSPTVQMNSTREIVMRHKSGDARTALHPPCFQLFALLYQCETCRNVPVSFLLKRQIWKLTIEGRSPFEEVEIPGFIPKTEQWLFKGAIVAHQTGNTLAGLFYLRSFIEQFARRQTGIEGKQTGEAIMEAYQLLIPAAQRDHMPSLRSWYEKLSAPIHTANPDVALFDEAHVAIVEHFDFRRLHKIAEAK
jgi:hypothetical protein